MKNHDVFRTGKTDERSNHDSGETKTRSRMLSVNLGSILRSIPVFLTSPRVNRGFSAKKKTVLRALHSFPIRDGLSTAVARSKFYLRPHVCQCCSRVG